MSIAMSHPQVTDDSHEPPPSDKWLIRGGVEAKCPKIQTSCHLVLGKGLGVSDNTTE